MAHTQRTGMAAATQTILTDDPDFLRFIVEWVSGRRYLDVTNFP